MNKTIYACYRGDDYICDGNIREIAARIGWKVDSVRWLTYPTARKRSNGYRKNGKPRKRITLVRI